MVYLLHIQQNFNYTKRYFFIKEEVILEKDFQQ